MMRLIARKGSHHEVVDGQGSKDPSMIGVPRRPFDNAGGLEVVEIHRTLYPCDEIPESRHVADPL